MMPTLPFLRPIPMPTPTTRRCAHPFVRVRIRTRETLIFETGQIFHPQHLSIERSIAPFFWIEQITIGHSDFLVGAMPGIAFTEPQRVELEFGTLPIGQQFVIRVSRRAVQIVCQVKDGAELPDVHAIEPAGLRVLHPHASRHAGSVDLLWDGWVIPEWVDARISDHYQAINDCVARRRAHLQHLEELMQPRRLMDSDESVSKKLDDILGAIKELIAIEKETDVLAYYAGEPFYDELEFNAWLEGVELME